MATTASSPVTVVWLLHESWRWIRCQVIELAHLTTAQKRALVIADNRLALDAGWDEAMLALELVDLSAAGYELALTDSRMLRSTHCLPTPPPPMSRSSRMRRPVMRRMPPMRCQMLRTYQVSISGDVWQLGSHRLICGDATDPVVATLMQDDTAQLCFTSPPYGNQRDYTSSGIADWDGLMRGVFAHLPMADEGKCWSTSG